jgi:hypothetical protein
MLRSLAMRAVLFLGLCGCSSILGLHDPSMGGVDDAPAVDGNRDGTTCYGSGLFTMCPPVAPTAALSLSGMIDTRGDSRCVIADQAMSGPSLCVMLGTTIDVADTIVIGDRPLVLVATQMITVSGTLDASSVGTTRIGAGGNVAACAAPAGGMSSQGGGGGAGGSFGTLGGRGGTGANGSAIGGVPAPAPGLVAIRGGCAGGTGGVGQTATAGGAGGASGGALYLIAAASITVTGAVFASGAGGGGGNPTVNVDRKGAGGGGGTGGLIGFDAPTISVSGIVAANGGGGGGGGDASQGMAGANGTTTQWNTPAAGGANEGGTHGAPGGAGGAGITAAADGDSVAGCCGAGGGGGGSVGIVYVKGALTGTMISPAPMIN